MKKKWEKKEEIDAQDFDGRRQRGSGNQWFRPGDVKTDIFLIENKQTDKKSYSISKKTLEKIYEEALFSYRYPLLSIKIQDKEIIVLFKEDFLKLTTSSLQPLSTK